MCAWCNPFFFSFFWNSITCTCTTTFLNICFFNNWSLKSCSFSWKTHAVKSGLFCDMWFSFNSSWIFFHLGLHVIVIKRSGFPNYWTNDIASKYWWRMSLGPPMNDVGKTILFPTLFALLSPANTLTMPWYNSTLIFDYYLR